MEFFRKRNGVPEDFTSHGMQHPVQSMLCSWFCYILAPVAALSWTSTKSWSITCGATLVTPALAILQGAIGILSYRAHFGDAPLPHLPSHGVVVVHPDDNSDDGKDSSQKACQPTSSSSSSLRHHHRHEQRPIAGLPLSSLCDGSCECTSAHIANNHTTFLQATMKERPIRLLVIGDSLAIGVGQEKSSTPVMPEAIGKTLSKMLGGRVVFWTCHGAPGASTGWIVREIERCSRQSSSSFVCEDDDDDDNVCGGGAATTATAISSSDDGEGDLDSLPGHTSANSTDTEDSTSDDDDDEEFSNSKSGFVSANASHEQCIRNNPALSEWKEQLTQHRRRFVDPEVFGPYDIVVCLTGSNDLKGAVFPFLLTGEDAEFRRQAKEIGGYPQQLGRLMETLNTNMRSRLLLNENIQRKLETFRHGVEVATETVREKVEETMEYISPGSSSRLHTPRSEGDRTPRNSRRFFADGESVDNDDDHVYDLDVSERSDSRRQLPLIVLPGMPSRSLPCFQKYPLRMISVPFVDVMDMHKRNFAKGFPGRVLFIPPPSMEQLTEYDDKSGEMWHQREREKTLLSLRDIRRRDSRKIENHMQTYYHAKKEKRKIDLKKFRLPLLSHIAEPSPGMGLFCVDQIHPRDEGYDFFGRYLGTNIAKEILNRNHHF